MLRTDNGRSTSLWMATASVPSFPTVDSDISCDVCIIGAGIAGLSIGYHLAVGGQQVVIIDDGPITGGETSRTTAHLTSAIDDRYFEMERLHGESGSRLAYESHQAAIERIAQIVQEEGIDCDFRRLEGYLFLSEDDKQATLQKELAAAHRAGFTDVKLVDQAPGTAQGGVPLVPALRFPRQGQFHVLKYLNGLVRAIERRGGRIFANTHAESVAGGIPAEIKVAGGHRILSKAIVVATNTPVNDWVEIHTKQMPYRTYVVAGRVARNSIPMALYWDTGDPYHYIRLQDSGDNDYEYLIVGGEDHKTGQADDGERRFRALEDWARARWPMIEQFDMRWSGQVMETQDGLGFIGRNPLDKDNVYIATGDSGMGMTHGTIAGMLISALILKGDHPWAKLYDPSRIRLAAAGEYIKENLNTAAQYKEYFTGGDVENEDLIPAGSGAIVRHGLTKVATYRDEAGKLHSCSAVCPHLGGIVQWNSLEKTWDCPAHGSRFAAEDGHVVNGPANSGLPASKSAEKKPAPQKEKEEEAA
ncbi:MAG TPA: FAD-dependent oxidoreductase [Terriglobales bacterium]|nr:FAD-dependent oxidoreductase [Terriglobales bacterium]